MIRISLGRYMSCIGGDDACLEVDILLSKVGAFIRTREHRPIKNGTVTRCERTDQQRCYDFMIGRAAA